jgi:hypothetical protein
LQIFLSLISALSPFSIWPFLWQREERRKFQSSCNNQATLITNYFKHRDNNFFLEMRKKSFSRGIDVQQKST